MKNRTVKILSLLLSLTLITCAFSSCAIIDRIAAGNSTNSSNIKNNFPAYVPGNYGGTGSGNNYPGYTPGANTPVGTTDANTYIPEATVPGNVQEPSSVLPSSTPATPTTPSSAVKTLTEITSTGNIPYNHYYNFSSVIDLSTTDTNLFPYKSSSKYGYADEKGNIVIPEQFDAVRAFSEGKAFVEKDEKWSIIDMDGNILYELPAAYKTSGTEAFENGKALCTYIDYYNKRTIALIINSDLSVQTIPIANYVEKVKLINSDNFTGLLIFDKSNNSSGIQGYRYRLYDVKADKIIWSIHLTNEKVGTALSSFEYDKILATDSAGKNMLKLINEKNGYINVFNEDFKWGLLNTSTGEMTLDYNYDYVGSYSDGLCNVCSYGKWGYVDLNGNKAIEFNYLFTDSFVNGTALVVVSDYSFCMIDTQGNIKYDCGCKLIKVSGSTCEFGIYTDLQKNGMIVIHDFFGDKYHIICIGGETETVEEFSTSITASPDHIFTGKIMYNYN